MTISKRLQYPYYTFRTNPGAAQGVDHIYKTYMPMMFDTVYALPDSMKYEDAYNRLVIYEGKTSEEAVALLKDPNGYFRPDQDESVIGFLFGFNSANPNDWNVLIKRDNVISNLNPPGVTTVFNTDSVVVTIDTSLFGVILDESTIEIVLEKAKTSTPWIYYGASRYDLATRLGKEATGMGGVHPSVVPADAIQMTYRMDNDVTVSLAGNFIIPLISVQFIPTPGFGAARKEVLMMWDILDGRLNSDGTARTAIRSSTQFNASSLSIQGGIGGFFSVTMAQTDWLIESYRNIHSRTLDYQTNTYHEKEFIKDTTFILMCENKSDFTDFYNDLANAFETYLYKFIDFTTCRFDIWSFSKGAENSIPVSLGISGYQNDDRTEDSVKSGIAGVLKSIVNGSANADGLTPSFEDCFKKMNNPDIPESGILPSLFASDVEAYENEPNEDLKIDPRNLKYSVVFLSDFNFYYQHNVTGEPVPEGVGGEEYVSPDAVSSEGALATFPLSVESGEYTNSNLSVVGSSIVIKGKETLYSIPPDSGNSVLYGDMIYKRAADIFSDSSAFSLVENENFGCFVIGFLDALSGRSINAETDMIEADTTVIGDVLESQCNAIVEESSFITSDRSGDGVLNLADRIYSIYTSGALAADNSAEFRYWRKVCPIGQLYRVKGTAGGTINTYKGDYYFLVDIEEETEEVEETEGTEEAEEAPKNQIWVYLERGAKTNSASSISSHNFELQGKLFYPEYFKNVNVDSFIDLRTVDGVTAWYRLREDTVRFLMEEMPKLPITAGGPKPILIVRSNYLLDPGTKDSPGSYYVPPFFDIGTLTDDKTYEFNAARRGTFDTVEDYFYNKTLELDPTSETEEGYIQIPRGGKIVCLDSDDDVPLDNLSMKMEIIDGIGDYEYEVRYKKADGSGPFLLWKFHSELAKISGDNTINIPLSGFHKLACEAGNENDGRTLYIKYSYSKKRTVYTEIDEVVSYDFVWDSSNFDVSGVWINEEKVGSGLSNNIYTISPSEGKIVFNNDITDRDLVQVEVINVSDITEEPNIGNYQITKNANYLEITRVADGIETVIDSTPKISDIELNIGNDSSIERVECCFSHSSRGTKKHYISPAYGFEYLAGDGSWFMNVDSGARILAGDINSPYFHIDRSLKPSDSKRYLDKTNETLVSIDRVYGNVTSLSQPFVETRTKFSPPQREVKEILKTSTEYSDSMERSTLIYNDGEILNTKYSFINFKSKDNVYLAGKKKGQKKYGIPGTTDSYIRANMRFSLPVRSSKTFISTDSPLFSGNSESPSFSIESRLGLLTGLVVTATPNRIAEYDLSEPFELYSSYGGEFVPFGYKSFNDVNTAMRFGSYTTRGSSSAKSYVRLPDTRDVDSLKISKPVNSNGNPISDVGNVTKVVGEYVDEYISGKNPQLYESKFGHYFLYYMDETDEKIMLLASKDDGISWNRPAVEANSTYDGTPIPIYHNTTRGVSAIGSLVGVSDNNAAYNILAFYDYNEEAVDMLLIPEVFVSRIVDGIGESANSEIQEGIPKSWETYFMNRSHVRRIINTSVDIFSITSSPEGSLYFFTLTPGGVLKVFVNVNLRPTQPEDSDWIDNGVDLLHEDSKLNKALDGRSVTSINAFYGGKGNGLVYVFLSTGDRKLIICSFSTFMFDITNKQEKIEIKQKSINKITPSLVIGDVSDLSEQSKANMLTNNSYLKKKKSFDAQIISGIWSKRGKFTFFYYDEDLNLKALETNSPSRDWRESENV